MTAGRHRDFLPVVLGVFALTLGYGLANDQWIVAIAPEHFTLYHPHYFPFEAAWAQALCFALVATGGPGLAWGILLYWAARYGKGPQIGRRTILIGAAVVLVITGGIAWGLGWHVSVTGQPLYPIYFYPSEDENLYVSQTVQLTNYLVGVLGAAGWLLTISYWRWWKTPKAETSK
jgi:hypothetical protein